uniref:Uncharacterized protein At2g39280 n=1 Tax=Arabidopsis thaliana TaxID=3702 RepID=O80953_ARATH|nr:unknown protein [Arabidopsis thaliana]
MFHLNILMLFFTDKLQEEEVERSARWSNFLEFHAESGVSPTNGSSENTHVNPSESDKKKEKELNKGAERKDLNADKPGSDLTPGNAREEDEVPNREKNVHKVQLWAEIRPSLQAIEDLMSVRVKMKGDSTNGEQEAQKLNSLASTDETESSKGVCENDSEDEFYDAERSDPIQDGSSDGTSVSSMSAAADAASLVSACPWKDELEVLIHGGAPMALRGELWQAFAGVKKRRVKNYYQNLLAADSLGNDIEQELMQHTDEKGSSTDPLSVVEKWKGQIEKDLPRTFPGHPALDDDFRNALRRLLTAYARHNPSVGYCQYGYMLTKMNISVICYLVSINHVQAMNFFAALLLLLMPEENAFWSLTGIIDDYFHDYYSEEMLESQVDQRVLEELLRERFPKLVLRVWDVLLFEGNRVMLFRTALALMEFYGPALVTTKDIGDAVTLLQSMTGSTFDSSQLVFTACMGYQNVHESKLQELRSKHRPAVIAAFEERLKGLQAWRDSKDTATKLHNSKQDPNSVLASKASLSNGSLSRSESGSSYADDIFISLTGDCEIDIFQDLQGQVICVILSVGLEMLPLGT